MAGDAYQPGTPAPAPRRAATDVAPHTGALIEIEYWTDPLCCWSWAFEPQWRRLRIELGGQLKWHYRMGGMIRDWNSYSDPLNCVSRPAQMGPVWFEARHISGMPIDDRIWMEDPPASSYLPCLAVKAAQLQSPRAADLLLRRVREAIMLRGQNVARRSVLMDVATALAAEQPATFDADRFARDLDSSQAADVFRDDLKEAAYREIGRFPTLLIRRVGATGGRVLVGYRPYAPLFDALQQLAPELRPSEDARSAAAHQPADYPLLAREREELSSAITPPTAPAESRSQV